MRGPKASGFVVCLSNEGFEASLEVRKLYQLLADPESAAHGLVRLIDESGQDYLYPAKMFRRVELPASLKKALRLAS
jgi:hypothetical protein